MTKEKQMSFISVSNTSIIDKTYGQPSNNYSDLMGVAELYRTNSPYSMGIFKALAAPGIPAIIDTFGPNDQGMAINSGNMSSKIPRPALAALMVTERYINFNQGNEHKVSIKWSNTSGSAPDDRTQEFIITPTGGVDTTSEYLLILSLPDVIFPSPTPDFNPWPTIGPSKYGHKGYLHPWEIVNENFVSVKWENVGPQNVVDISVQTVWLHGDSVKTLGQILSA